MNNQQPYILPWQAYGLNGFSSPLGVSISSPLQAQQLGKLAGLPMAQQAYQQHQSLVSMGSALAGIPGLAQISFAGQGGLQLAGAGVYPIMSPSLSPYSMQSPPPGIGMNPTVLTNNGINTIPKLFMPSVKDAGLLSINGFAVPAKLAEKRKLIEEIAHNDVKKAKLETKALKAKRPGFTDDRYSETSYYVENGLRKVYPYYFTFTTFTKGRWVGEKILDVFAREFRAHPVEEYERCILDGTLTVNYEQVDTEYRLRHNDLLANIVHRHETPVLSKPIEVIHLSEELVVLDKPCSLPG